MAPEQADGKTVDARADLFSLGCVLYRMATGEMAFKGDGVMQILRAIELAEPVEPSQMNPALPRELSELILNLLAKRASDRMPSAEQVVRRLRILESKPSPASIVAPATADIARPTDIAKTRSRWPLMVGMAVVGIAGLFWLGQIVIRYIDEKGEKREIVLPKGAKDAEVVRPPLPIMATGEPLSPLALVSQPTKLQGVRSWTIEPIGHRSRVRWATFSSDGRWLATADYLGDAVRIWRADTGDLVRMVVGKGIGSRPVNGARWTPEQKDYFAGGGPTIELWDSSTSKPLARFKSDGEHDWRQRCTVSPDGKIVVLGKYFFDAKSSELILSKDLGSYPVFSPDNKFLATTIPLDDGCTVRIWAMDTFKMIQECKVPKSGEIGPLRWLADGKTVVGSNRDRIWFVNADTGNLNGVITPNKQQNSMQGPWLVSPNGKLLAGVNHIGNYLFYIFLCDAQTGKFIGSFESMATSWDEIAPLAWSPESKTLVASNSSGTVFMYDVSALKPKHIIMGRRFGPVGALTWLTDGSALIADPQGMDYGRAPVRSWDPVSGKAIDNDLKPVTSRSPDGKHKGGLAYSCDARFVAGRENDLVTIRETKTGRLVKSIPSKMGGVALSPTGQSLVLFDFSYHGWPLVEIANGKPLASIVTRGLKGGHPSIRCVSFSPDEKHLAVGTDNGFFVRPTLEDRTSLQIESGGWTSALAWSPDSKRLATADNAIRIWSLPSGRPLGVLSMLGQNMGIAISAEGHVRASPAAMREIVYVVQTDHGQETLTPAEMEKKYGWKNDPYKVRLTSNYADPEPAKKEPNQPAPQESKIGITLLKAEDGKDMPSVPPPPGAVVLFGGKNFDEWKQSWILRDGGVMEVANGDLVSNKSFGGKFKLHVEFRVPFMPEAKGLYRGNSGIFVQGRYEIQILDSYGIKNMGKEDCGAIYGVAPPIVNACKAPTVWQTFDLEFTSPTFENKKLITPGIVTLHQNGVRIHDNVKINVAETGGGLGGDPATPGPIMLQQHACPVQFRNIWLLQMKD